MNFFKRMHAYAMFFITLITTLNVYAAQSCDESKQTAIVQEIAQSHKDSLDSNKKTNSDEIAVFNIKSDLEATLTIAELQEILIKINDDLDNRIAYLENANKHEIADVLKARKEVIIKKLKDLQGFEAQMVIEYLARSHKRSHKKLLLCITGVVVTIAVTTLLLSSYDSDRGWTIPSSDLLKKNFWNIIAWVKGHVSGMTQQAAAQSATGSTPVKNGTTTLSVPAVGSSTTSNNMTNQPVVNSVSSASSVSTTSVPVVSSPGSFVTAAKSTTDHIQATTSNSSVSISIGSSTSTTSPQGDISQDQVTSASSSSTVSASTQSTISSTQSGNSSFSSTNSSSSPSNTQDALVTTATSSTMAKVGWWGRFKNWASDTKISIFGESIDDDSQSIEEDRFF